MLTYQANINRLEKGILMSLVKILSITAAVFSMAACTSNQAPSVQASSSEAGASATSSVVANSVFFAFNGSDITSKYNKLLTVNAGYLISHTDAKVQIQGNSSEIGTVQHNQKLGLERAQSVKQALVKLGVPAKQISVVSFGNTKPAYPTETGGEQPKNQRVDIVYTSTPPYQYTLKKTPMIDTSTMY